jgi:hypothetical protein
MCPLTTRCLFRQMLTELWFHGSQSGVKYKFWEVELKIPVKILLQSSEWLAGFSQQCT